MNAKQERHQFFWTLTSSRITQRATNSLIEAHV
jgi:hypothetical protein